VTPGPFAPTKPVRFEGNLPLLGPSSSEPCPCGSGRLPSNCHVDIAVGGWVLPPYGPLLTDSRTGIACEGCYASSTSDCRPPLTKEHWLSEGVLRAAGDGEPLRLLGLSWAQSQEISLHPPSLVSYILCDRHNNALSRLDSTAKVVFSALRRYQQDLVKQSDPHGNEFLLASGEELARWVLKTLWGATAAKVIAVDGRPISRLHRAADPEILAEYLFRGGVLPSGWGLHVVGRPGAPFSAEAEATIRMQRDTEGHLVFGTADMGVVSFGFSLNTLQAGSGQVIRRQPSGVYLVDEGRSTQKVVALAWDDRPEEPCVLTFVGRQNKGAPKTIT